MSKLLLMLLLSFAVFAQSSGNQGQLKDLKKDLTTLDLSMTEVTDLAPLKELKNLSKLYLGYTRVSDLGPLKDLKDLTELGLNGTRVSDLEPLKGLKNLT